MHEDAFFSGLYEEHKDMVYNLCLSYTQNTEDAEEITQDVFIKVYQNIIKFKGEASLKTWIYRISVNQSLDYLKAGKAKKRLSFITSLLRFESNDTFAQIPDFNHPGVLMENKEAMQKLFRLINELPYNQKTVLILKVMESLSQKEIAEIMKLTEKAVDSLFSRAKKNLNDKIMKAKDY